MRNRATQRNASTGLRIAAALCLGSIIFASVRILGKGSLSELKNMLFGGLPMHISFMITGMLVFALPASLFILLTGKRPDTSDAPIVIEERFARNRKEMIYKIIMLATIGAFIIAMLVLILMMDKEIR